jgi:hypothetical protein
VTLRIVTKPFSLVAATVLSVATGVLGAACTAAEPVERSAGPEPTTPPATATPAAPGVEPSGDGSTVPCAHAIGALDQPEGGRTVVAGVVALPIGAVLQANPTGAARPRWFAKDGLVVRADAVVELRVPAGSADRLRVGWGSPAQPGAVVRLAGCPDRSGWLVFAGGYWVDEPACLPLLVRAGGHQEQVRIAVGVPCPTG